MITYRYKTPNGTILAITLPAGVSPPRFFFTDWGEARFDGWREQKAAA